MEYKNKILNSTTELLKGDFMGENDLPEFYRRFVEHSCGNNSRIHTELWLPKTWNGVLAVLGNGGLAGNINHFVLARYIRGGYAAMQTDMGTADLMHRGGGSDDVVKDFGWRATHESAVMCKQMVKEITGKEADHAYFIGESTGGQQALAAAQRFPYDYDGIIAGVPANNRIALHTYFLWNYLALTDENGKGMFNQEDADKLTEYAVSFFEDEGDDGARLGFVSYPWLGDDTPERFIRYLEKINAFDSEKRAALLKVYKGPRDPKNGKQIYNGMPIGSEKYWCGVATFNGECPHFYPFAFTFGEDYTGRNFDFSGDFQAIKDKLSADLDANSHDLTAFKAHGGKLLMYSGSADPCVPYPDAMRYCECLNEKYGGYEKASEFYRYFLVPGRDHGEWGDGVNALNGEKGGELIEVLRDWCENGIVPSKLIGSRVKDGQTLFSLEIFPYLSEKSPKKPLPPTNY